MSEALPRFLSPAQVAKELGISSATCARRIKDRSIPSSLIGKRRIVAREWLDRLTASALGDSAATTAER